MTRFVQAKDRVLIEEELRTHAERIARLEVALAGRSRCDETLRQWSDGIVLIITTALALAERL